MKCYQRLWYINKLYTASEGFGISLPHLDSMHLAGIPHLKWSYHRLWCNLLPTVTSPLTGALNILSAATLTHRLISFATYMYGIFESFCDILHERISQSLRKFLNPCFDASVLFGGVGKWFFLCGVPVFVERMSIVVRLRRLAM